MREYCIVYSSNKYRETEGIKVITASLRATGRSGAEVGNMWKSVLGSINSKNAVKELKALGVETKDLHGNLRPVQDVLTDLMIKMAGTEKNTEEVTKAVAGGKFQWAKLGASLGDMQTYLTATAISINSNGKAAEYMQAQMDTVSRKTEQFHQSLIALVNSAGNNGLTGVIKGLLDNLRYFVDGLNNGGVKALALASGTMVAVVAIDKIVAVIKDAAEAQKALNAVQAIGLILSGNWAKIAIAGIAVAAVGATIAMGKQADQTQELLNRQKNQVEQQKAMISQYQDEIQYVNELEQTRNKLINTMKGMADTDQRKIELNKDLTATEDALKETVGASTAETIKNANYSHDAFQLVTKSLQAKQDAERVAWQNSQQLVTNATNHLKQNILIQMEQVDKAIQAYGILGKLQETGLAVEKNLAYARFQLSPTDANAKAYDDIMQNISDFYANQKNNRMSELMSQLNALGGTSSNIGISDIPTGDNLSGFKNVPMDDTSSTKKTATPETSAQADILSAQIRSFNYTSDQDKLENSILQKKIQTAKQAKDYNSELTLSNQLLSGQKKQIEDLNTANQNINAEKERVNSQYSFDTSSWFDANGNSTVAYEQQFQDASKKTQDQMKKEFDALEKLNKAYQTNSDTIKTLIESQDSLRTSLVQLGIDKYNDEISYWNDLTTKAKDTMALYNVTSSEYAQSQQNYVSNLREVGVAIDTNIEKIQKALSNPTSLSPEALKLYSDQFDKLQTEKLVNQKNIIDAKYDPQFKGYENQQKQNDELQKSLDLQLKISEALNPKNYDQINVVYQAQISAQETSLAQTQNVITALSAQRDKLQENTYEWQHINDEITKYESHLDSTMRNLPTLYRNLMTNQVNSSLRSTELTIFNGQTEQQAKQDLQNRTDYQNNYISGTEKEAAILRIRNQLQLDNAELNQGIVGYQKYSIQFSQQQLDLLNSANDIKRSDLDLLEKQLAIQKTQMELSKEQNQKTIRQLVHNTDGTWDYAYVSDQSKVLSLQGQLYQEQQDLAKSQLDNQNKQDQLLLNQKSEYYNNIKTVVDNAMSGQYATTTEYNNAMLNANSGFLSSLQGTNFSIWNSISSNVRGNINTMLSSYQNYIDQMQILQAKINTIVPNQPFAPNTTNTNSTSGVGSIIGTSVGGTQNNNLVTVRTSNGTSTVLAGSVFDPSSSNYRGYANGTENSPEGFAITGEEGPELTYLNKGRAVIPANLTKNIMAFGANPLNYMQNMLSNIKIPQIPSFSNVGKNISPTQTFHINSLEFPNVKSADGITDALKNLPNYVLQYTT